MCNENSAVQLTVINVGNSGSLFDLCSKVHLASWLLLHLFGLHLYITSVWGLMCNFENCATRCSVTSLL